MQHLTADGIEKKFSPASLFFECENEMPDLLRPFMLRWERRSAGYRSKGSRRIGDHAIFHYCISGRGTMRYAGRDYPVLPGSGFLGVIDEIDYAYPDDGTEDWCFFWFGYRGGNYKEMTHFLVESAGPVFPLSGEDAFITKLNMLKRHQSLRLNAFQAASLVCELLGALKKQKDQDHFSMLPEVVRLAILQIRSAQRVPRVSELADSLGFSREHLSRIFQHAMGTSLQDFLTEHCNERAKKLLLTTDLPIAAVAWECGYQSESSFIRMFREKNQISPEKFRLFTTRSYSIAPPRK